MRICSMKETEVIPTEQHVWLLKFDDSLAVHLGAIGSEVSVLFSPNDVPHSPKQGDRLLVLGSGPSSIDGHPDDEATETVERWLSASGVDAYWLLPAAGPATAGILNAALAREDSLVIYGASRAGDCVWLKLEKHTTCSEDLADTREEILSQSLQLFHTSFGEQQTSTCQGRGTASQADALPSIRSQLILKIAPLAKPLKQRLPKQVVVTLYKILEKIR